MTTFTCQCGCGQTQEVSKHWHPKKELPRYIAGHNLKGIKKERKVPEVYTEKVAVSFLDRVTPSQIERIKQEYHPADRTHLAREMGIPKTIFNFICIELGLRKESKGA